MHPADAGPGKARQDVRRRFTALLLAVALGLSGCLDAEADSSDEVATPVEDATAPPTPAHTPTPTPTPEATPTPTPAAPEPPPLPPTWPALVERAEALVRAAVGEMDQGELAVLVTDEHGREVVGHRPDEPVLPASTLKIVTAAAVLSTLGGEERLTTRLETTAAIAGDGTVDGDLVLVGAGDPTLVTDEYARWIYPARPRTRLSELADTLVERGVTRITGGVIGTAEGFGGPPTAEGWQDRYFSDLDARNIAGLTVDGGLVTSIRWPQLDERARERWRKRAEEAGEDLEELEPPDPVRIPLVGTQQEIEERLAGLDPPLAVVDHAPDPVAHAAQELARLLEDRGVEVEGDSGALEEGTELPVVGRLASLQSPPMEDVLRFAVQRSDNHLTDHLFWLIGRTRTGEGSWERGDRALRQVLDRFGVDHTGAHFADGSGLSRADRVTARLLVDLDRAMTDSRFGATWGTLMAVSGESGTLRQRLAGTPAAGRFLGKTGTLRDVTGLAGMVVGDDGGRYHLAVIANEATGADRWTTRALMDELVLLLVAEVQGCAIGPAPGADAGPLGVPPSVVAC
jgi:serine-type D-Ala-D-Ala carboxypeptidase/endopeptidase (penicillin-binding protein 4)